MIAFSRLQVTWVVAVLLLTVGCGGGGSSSESSPTYPSIPTNPSMPAEEPVCSDASLRVWAVNLGSHFQTQGDLTTHVYSEVMITLQATGCSALLEGFSPTVEGLFVAREDDSVTASLLTEEGTVLLPTNVVINPDRTCKFVFSGMDIWIPPGHPMEITLIVESFNSADRSSPDDPQSLRIQLDFEDGVYWGDGVEAFEPVDVQPIIYHVMDYWS